MLPLVPYITAAAMSIGGIYFFVEVLSPSFRASKVKGIGNAVGDGNVVDSSIQFGGAKRLAELSQAQLDMFGLVATAARVAAAEERAIRAMEIEATVKQAEIHKEEVTNLANAQVTQAANLAHAQLKQAEIHLEEVTNLANAQVTQAHAQVTQAHAQLKQTETMVRFGYAAVAAAFGIAVVALNKAAK